MIPLQLLNIKLPIPEPTFTDAQVAKLKAGEVFGAGNSKLGKRVLTWSLPAIYTCPGSSDLCRGLCYADSGFYQQPSVKASLARKMALARRDDFADLCIRLLQPMGERYFRIHVAGDFYSAEYLKKWIRIVKACPDVKFWAFTRSWRVKGMLPDIEKLAGLKNIRLWYSVDKETGFPAKLPKRARTAYMQISDDDLPKQKPDLYFRDHKVRGGVQKFIGGRFVCAAENGATDVTCEKCKVCFREARPPRVA